MNRPQADDNIVRVMCLGDIVARPGRKIVKKFAKELREIHQVDLLIANGENASGGTGLDPESAQEIKGSGVDIITLGDHTWRRRELHGYLRRSTSSFCLRPDNYPKQAPGQGWTTWTSPGGVKVGVMNLMGRTFMNLPLDCPFRQADQLLEGPLVDCDLSVCDFHAEATSEKIALGRYLDGRLSLLVGTHTHVPTADTQVLPRGTGYVTDLGMCGCSEGVIGLDAAVAVKRFLTGIPHTYKPAKGCAAIQGVVAALEVSSGRALEVKRIDLMDS